MKYTKCINSIPVDIKSVQETVHVLSDGSTNIVMLKTLHK